MHVTTLTKQDVRALVEERQGARSNSVDRVMLGLIAVATCALLAYVALAPIESAIFRVTDDAYYYFKVAGRVVAGEGLTFDGINRTNGFHPLWMLCLVPGYWIFGAEAEIGLRAALGLVALVAGGAFWIAYNCVRVYAGRAGAVVAVGALLAPVCLNPLLNGLETGLLTLLLFGTLWAGREAGLLSLHAGRGRNVALGVLLGLVFLCRLDTAFFVLAVVGLIALRWLAHCEGKVPIRCLVVKYVEVGLTGLALTGPYLVWNFMTFGHVAPISGALKSSFPSVQFSAEKLDRPYVLLALGELGLALVVFLWLALRRRRPGAQEGAGRELCLGGQADMLWALWAGCALHFANTLLFMNWAVHWWHFASYVPLAVLAGALAFARVHEVLRRSRWGGGVGSRGWVECECVRPALGRGAAGRAPRAVV